MELAPCLVNALQSALCTSVSPYMTPEHTAEALDVEPYVVSSSSEHLSIISEAVSWTVRYIYLQCVNLTIDSFKNCF